MSDADARRSRLPIPVVVAMLTAATLCLRWPYQVTLDTLRGAGYTDRTIVAFVSTFLMIAGGFPGLLVAGMGTRVESTPRRILVAASLVSMLIGSLASLVWIGASVRVIGSTLSPVQVAGGVAPPVATALIAIWLRFRFRSESGNSEP